MLPVNEILTRGVTNLLVKEEMEKDLKEGKKLRIKFGIDPTSRDIHIGHAIPYWKLRNFQDHGHQIVILIGDFTARIGDASDKTAERQMLSKEQIEENMSSYLEQIGKIIDMDNVEVVYNSQWLEKLDFNDISKLAQNFSVSQMLDRDNFSKRYEKGVRIGLQEFLYPLMQGYDSVAIKADLELGGNDQYFNLMAGRILQKAFGQAPQFIMTNELLVGLDGRKMSSSYGNTISIIDSPQQQFGKIMSMSDDLIIKYFEMTTQLTLAEIKVIEDDIKKGGNPRDAKMRLGYEIVKLYHGQEEAKKAQEGFIAQFSQKQRPTDIPKFTPSATKMKLVDLIVEAKLQDSKGNARRIIEQGGVKIDDDKVSDVNLEVQTQSGMVIQVGKRSFIEIS